MPGANSATPSLISHQYSLHPARTLPRSAIPRIRPTTDTGSGALPKAPHLHHMPTTLPPPHTQSLGIKDIKFTFHHHHLLTHHQLHPRYLIHNTNHTGHALERARALYLLHLNLRPTRELRGQPLLAFQDEPSITLHFLAVLLEDRSAHQKLISLPTIMTL